MFLNYLDKPYLAYDIKPDDKRITKQDYLTLDLSYKKGRCAIGNPPFGTKNNLTVQFYKKLINECDYISLILPISQYKNDIKLYEFNLVHSEDLGEQQYSDRKIHCCLNIYKKPKNTLNKKPIYKLQDIEIIERIKNSNPKRNKPFDVLNEDYDIRMIGWGAGTGRFLNRTDKQYAKEFIIKIHNDVYKNKIINLLKHTNWVKEYAMTATPNLSQWQIYKYIKEQIPEIS